MIRIVAGDGVITAKYLVYVGSTCVAASDNLAVATVYLRLALATEEALYDREKDLPDTTREVTP